MPTRPKSANRIKEFTNVEFPQNDENKIIPQNILLAKSENQQYTSYLEYYLNSPKELTIVKLVTISNNMKNGHKNTKNVFFSIEEPITRRVLKIILNGKSLNVKNPKHFMKYN